MRERRRFFFKLTASKPCILSADFFLKLHGKPYQLSLEGKQPLPLIRFRTVKNLRRVTRGRNKKLEREFVAWSLKVRERQRILALVQRYISCF